MSSARTTTAAGLTGSPTAPRFANRNLLLIGASELLSMGLWFSATAVSPALASEWHLTNSDQAWLTMSVQLGFVAGALASAWLNLSDIWNPRKLFLWSAVAGAAFTASIAGFATGPVSIIALRFLTGAALAGVYPPGMKIIAGWFRSNRGMAIGALVGALTVGSASPHLLKVFSAPGSWRAILYLAAFMAVIGGLVAGFLVADGPYMNRAAPFDPAAVARILRNKPVLFANLAYFGHMWELYAFWAWISVFLAASFAARDVSARTASLATFAVIAVGGLGCYFAGVWADRWGRTALVTISMAISGSCCVIAGLLFGGSPPLLFGLCLLWGFWVVADSAQFSACVTELADPIYVGSALTIQTAAGFALTVVSIRAMATFVSLLSWKWAFAPLSVGPILGIWAALRLRRRPESLLLAGGRK